ncbi:hypothetical protein [Verrucomicrobium spinosum]|uniref:hypothetical protein n=1 Tax=Verrucomicrobium spinosum TaxID=2736 RepID=UPI000AF387B9|nr:hypothetical protein [Verrucomicrobium spinosum]
MHFRPPVLTLLTACAAALPLSAAAPKDVAVTIKTLPAQMRYDTERSSPNRVRR